MPSPFVRGAKKDVWSIINEAAESAEKTLKKPIINLGQGFFSYSPPKFAIKAAKDALDSPLLNQYAPTRGLLSTRESICTAYSKFFNKNLNPNTDIVITAGANEAMLSAFFAFITHGDEVIVFEPFFDQYISNIEMPGGKVIYVPLHPPSDRIINNEINNNSQNGYSASLWTINFEELEKAINKNTKMIVINTPHNPVGKILSYNECKKLADIAIKNNIIILSDEVYDSLYYSPFTRIATLSPEIAKLTLTVGSGGKTFAATGWRIGWIIGDKDLIKYVATANTRIVFAANTPLQAAIGKSFQIVNQENNTYFQDQRNSYQEKIKILTNVFDKLKMTYIIPQGGYFILVDFSNIKIPTDYQFPIDIKNREIDFKKAYWLIREIGVVAIPPTEFYTPEHAHLASSYLRFAICKENHYLEKAAQRLLDLQNHLDN